MIRNNVMVMSELAAALKIPSVIPLSLRVTDLEYRFLAETAPLFQWDQPSQVYLSELRALVQEIRRREGLFGTLDGQDASRLISHLRTDSPYLRRAWSPADFDRYID
jgi:hypothetical protein